MDTFEPGVHGLQLVAPFSTAANAHAAVAGLLVVANTTPFGTPLGELTVAAYVPA